MLTGSEANAFAATPKSTESLETEIWENVCEIVKNPGSLEQENQYGSQLNALPENVDTLSAQRQKLRHGMERLIESLAEGVIDKDSSHLA